MSLKKIPFRIKNEKETELTFSHTQQRIVSFATTNFRSTLYWYRRRNWVREFVFAKQKQGGKGINNLVTILMFVSPSLLWSKRRFIRLSKMTNAVTGSDIYDQNAWICLLLWSCVLCRWECRNSSEADVVQHGFIPIKSISSRLIDGREVIKGKLRYY